jgi:hypothetical protein
VSSSTRDYEIRLKRGSFVGDPEGYKEKALQRRAIGEPERGLAYLGL